MPVACYTYYTFTAAKPQALPRRHLLGPREWVDPESYKT